MGVTFAGGEAEMCAVRSRVSLGFRGFFVVVARRDVWRLPVFFVATGTADSGEGWLISSVVLFFFGTGVQWLKSVQLVYRSSTRSQVLSRPLYEIG
jgi:hypothetical protein